LNEQNDIMPGDWGIDITDVPADPLRLYQEL
jgi:hypothetical protein